ncbi:lysyl oxidase homolog 3 isoform X3 [Pseudophryne corroboree]|uniref:lysyl oxidase homolog 3 isoform X3 n=1 Tax=Pseudophryne corroboree TaxID=495146 RepID=UPI0030812746
MTAARAPQVTHMGGRGGKSLNRDTHTEAEERRRETRRRAAGRRQTTEADEETGEPQAAAGATPKLAHNYGPYARMDLSASLWVLCTVSALVPVWTQQTPLPTNRSPNQSSSVKFRLAGFPRKHNEGRIEVFYNQEWGTICDDDFTMENAHILCRHLGFTEATGWTHSAKYGKGIGRIWLDNVICSGSEKSISDCSSRGWGNSDCTHEEDAGVICKDERIPGYVEPNTIETEQRQVEEIRLRPVIANAKNRLPINEGILEIKYRDAWEQVCDEGWSQKNSHVVCGMLGFPSEKKFNKNFYKSPPSQDPQKKELKTSNRLYLDKQKPSFRLHSVKCAGTEVHLSLCPLEFYKVNGTAGCQDGAPVVVSCTLGPVFSAQAASGQAAMKKKKVTQPQHEEIIRLKGGARPGEGRVEVLKNGQWGTVCDDRWDLQAASVVCRELGFGSAKEALTGARMGQGMGPIHMNEVKCSGTEKSLLECQYKNITEEDCKHTEDSAIKCNIPYMGYDATIRLAGGRSPHEGRVEVLLGPRGEERWGLVCGNGWGTKEAAVVCQQLGLGFVSSALQETWYWDASNVTEMILSGVRCSGPEMSLQQCYHHRTVSCKNAGTRHAAGVICSETASDLVLHAPLVQETAYIEDRPLHMLYCAAEENCLSSTARNANWPYGHRRLLRFSSQIHNIGRADFRPKAGRHSWVWHECHGHYHSMDIFTNYDLLTSNGTKVAEGHKASFCLEDSECQESVSKRYECANFGEQGITVGCWDLYRHDIDCQWIDITDVKPGNYILQVVINPNSEVAESDFTNNAMKCNCKYDGHRIWIHNCHIGDTLSEEANKRFEQYRGQLNNQIL